MKSLDDILVRCSDVVALAQGGQKTVLSASHPEYGDVVIKHGSYKYTAGIERISREVGLLKELESDFYPTQHEFLIDPTSMEFLIVEERFQAVELSKVKEKFSTDKDIISLLHKLINALNIIWERSVIHRDIKPANILITEENEPRIIDLGIARFLDDTSLTQTMAGQGPGTPIYASPEQLKNKKSMINVRTDFFLLGILVLELLNGFHPFDPQQVGNQDSLVNNILNGLYVRPSGEHDEILINFIEGTLNIQPYKRPKNVKALKQLLGME